MKKVKKKNNKTEVIDIVIAVYNPPMNIFSRVKEMLKKQTIKNNVIEVWNMPEAVAVNTGIKKSKSSIVVNMCQDCVPEDEKWLERLIEPFKDPEVIATNSDTLLPYEYWKKYDLISKTLTIKEQKIIRSLFDARGCAFRRELLEEIGFISEDPNLMAIDTDIYMKIAGKGKIVYPGCKILHFHPLTAYKRLRLEYTYPQASGAIFRLYWAKFPGWWKMLIRATPVLGILSILLAFPIFRAPLLFFIYLPLVPLLHVFYLMGFWKGFFRQKK